MPPVDSGTLSDALRSLLLCLTVGALAGCDSAPTSPSSQAGFQGEWAGAVTQGGDVRFTVSAQQTVIAVVVNYQLNGCQGTVTLSGPALPIADQRLPSGEVLPPSFGSGTQGIEGPDFVGLSGWFPSDTTARGLLIFTDFRGCGSAIFSWNATRR